MVLWAGSRWDTLSLCFVVKICWDTSNFACGGQDLGRYLKFGQDPDQDPGWKPQVLCFAVKMPVGIPEVCGQEHSWDIKFVAPSIYEPRGAPSHSYQSRLVASRAIAYLLQKRRQAQHGSSLRESTTVEGVVEV